MTNYRSLFLLHMGEKLNYDGTLALVLDDDVLTEDFWRKTCDNGKALFQNEQTGEFVPVVSPILYYIGLISHFTKLFGANNHVVKSYQEGLQECAELGKMLPNPEMYEIITEGRIRLAFLLDTPGGAGLLLKPFSGLVQDIQRRGGEVRAFGGKLVASLGALIFMQAGKEKRHIMRDSKLIFHMSTGALGQDAFALGQRESDWHMLQKLLLENVHPELRGLIETMMEKALREEAEKPDRPLIFTGTEAENAGLAEVASDSLRPVFEGIHEVPEETYTGTPLQTFFNTQEAP